MNHQDTITLYSNRLILIARSMHTPIGTRKHIIEEWDGQGNFISAKLFVSPKNNQGQLLVLISDKEKNGEKVFEHRESVDIEWPSLDESEEIEDEV